MDKWEEYQNMSTDKLMAEIEKMNKILFRLNGGTPMFNQMQDMIALANQVMQDKFAITRLESDENANKALNIGEIESEVIHPEYDKDVLNLVATSYVSNLRDNKK